MSSPSSSIVPGDRYLESLTRFVFHNAGQLLDGTLTLKLNPAGLHYVQSRLDSLLEIEALTDAAPVDYLRAYVSDLGDHRALEQLRRILGLLTSLKVVSVLGNSRVRDLTPVSVAEFGNLRVLELRGCDLSTSAARGLLELLGCLEKIIVHNSTDALRHVFASRIVDIKDSPVWNRLTFVSCACNGLVLMDESLQLLPVVETLDLSRNQFAKVANLRKCTKLQHLDLGFNHLRSISSLSEVSCPLVKLVLRNNALTTLRGIENLKSLEGLDLSYNIISCFTELEILASLPCLQSLWLEGNPLYCARWYRAHVFSFFSHPEKLILDDNGISRREYWERHIILASRQKLPSGYGFYFPAKDAEDEGNLKTKRKTYYRLASIEDEEQRRYFCSEAAEQESVSCDGDNQMKDENSISDDESEIVSLMNKVEYMKKERSILWLREFQEWMDQTPDYPVERNISTRFDTNAGSEKYLKESKGERFLSESSGHVPDLEQASEGDNNSNVLEPDIPFSDACTGSYGNGYFDANGKTIMEQSTVNGNGATKTAMRTEGISPEQGLVKLHSWKPHNLSRLDVKSSPCYNSLAADGWDPREKITSVSLTAIDEIMSSHSSSTYPRSPPHYQEDLLQRRLFLEEEFLQLSAESQSLASSESETSSSDDGSRKSSASIAEFDHFFLQNSIGQDITDKSTEIPQKSNNHEGRHEVRSLRNNPITSEICYEPNSSVNKRVLPTYDKQYSSHCNSDDGNTFFTGDNLNHHNCNTENQKGKQKHMGRVISLSGSSALSNTGCEFRKRNGILEVEENMRHEGRSLRNNPIMSEIRYEPDSSVNTWVLPNYDKQYSGHCNSDDGNTFFTDDNLNHHNCNTENQKGKQKHMDGVVSLSGNSALSNTGHEFRKPNGVLEVEENVRDREEQPSCSETYINEPCEGCTAILLDSSEMNVSPSKSISFNPDQDQFIKDCFHLEFADSRASETCQQLIRCECIYQLESVFHESEVCLLRSCKNKLYILLIDVIASRQETIPKVLGCHRIEDLGEVVIGLGLQTLRVNMERNFTYLFLPRTAEESEDLFCLLGVDDSTTPSTGCCLLSWEKVQVNLLEKNIFGSIKMGITLYSVLLFWHASHEGKSWIVRSLFVVEGYLLVCIENLVNFGCSAEDADPPYYSLDSCCPIQNILELAIELNNDRCMTLTLNNISTSGNCFIDKIDTRTQSKKTNAGVSTWKLKWFSEETMLKFVAVVKAIHSELTASALPVKCIS